MTSSSNFSISLSVRYFLLSTFAFLVIGCETKDQYDPDKYLNAIQKDKFVNTVFRYSAKAPEGVEGNGRFDKKHDAYYLDKASRV
jgi:hypothetical protein